MGNKLGFGIWGCGMISRYHADSINKIDDAVLTGAFDLNKNSMDNFCEEYGIIGCESAEELVSSSDIDAVCICLPSGLHFEAAMKCISNKKHVMIEKPLAINIEDIDKIIEAAKENNVFVGVVSQFRYSDAFKKIKEMMGGGKLGRITVGNAHMKYYRTPEYYLSSKWRGTWDMDGGGALMNQSIHGVDLLQHLMGKVVSVSAIMGTLVHNIEVEDTLTAVVEYESGAIGTIQATTSVFPGYNRKIEICGSKGSVVLNEDTIEICDVEGFENEADGKSAKTASANRPDGIDVNLHTRQIADFVRSVRENREPWINAVEGRKAVEIICAIYESAKTGKKVYL